MRFYRLDAADTIEATDPGWDSFATENGGADAVTARVLGRNLWDCVTGDETCATLDRLFHNARRSDTPWGMRYRCDSPRTERLFQLTASPEPGRTLVVRHVLIRSRPRIRDVVKDLSRHERVWHCSQCLSYSAPAHRFDPVHIAAPQDRQQVLDHVCKDCRVTMQPAWTAVCAPSIA